MSAFEDAIREHDASIARAGLTIWVGGEPTFSDRSTFAAEWVWAAHGDDKEARARRVVARLHAELGGVVLRTLGRQYDGEERPRWSYGIWARRDGAPVWDGPPDPLGEPPAVPCTATPGSFRDALAAALERAGGTTARLDVEGPLPARVVYRLDAQAPPSALADEPALGRPPLAGGKVPPEGVVDALAAGGVFLVAVGRADDEPGAPLSVELPGVPDVAGLLALLGHLAEAARACGCGALVLTGHGPPVDGSIRWLTATPDPGVLELNMAPSTDVTGYLAALRQVHAACAAEGLSPLRYLYTGETTDSGGGGHLTLGGPSAAGSPFFLHPRLLPALVAYANRHPCLSYLFAVDSLGSSSQSPRADETVRESFDELGLTLERLAALDTIEPEVLWRSLAPFLVDRAGNCHRAEINVEKLWNPALPGRGKLGVVELRSFRMPRTPERGAALAVLLRSVVAMLARDPVVAPLVDWGDELHDRFALPFHLEHDLERILSDVAACGIALPEAIRRELRDDRERRVGRFEALGHALVVRHAVEFWPLVGDSAHMERSTSRTVDASTRRLEVVLRPLPGTRPALDESVLSLDGHVLPMAREEDGHGPARVLGLRYRTFVPQVGLHPGLPAQGVVRLRWDWPAHGVAWELAVHGWRPDGGAYDGLPADADEAGARVAERFVVRAVEPAPAPARPFPARATRRHHVDLRRL